MIGVFDSGLGGLTVLKALIRDKGLSKYDYIYLGDSARAPYGSKSRELIYQYTIEAVDFLFKAGCHLVIIACNTASAEALRQLQQEWLPRHYPRRRVLGVTIPVAEAAAEDGARNIGVIGTRTTIGSKVYEKELIKAYKNAGLIGGHRSKARQDIRIHALPTPLLVPLVEEGWAGRPETLSILKWYLEPMKKIKIDSLILGCTHYPFLLDDIKRIMGPHVHVLDSPHIVAIKLREYLQRHPEIEAKISKSKKRIYLTTDDPKRFRELGEQFFESKMSKVKKVEI